MTEQDLSKLSSEELLNEYSVLMEGYNGDHKWRIELETHYNELTRRLAVYDKSIPRSEEDEEFHRNFGFYPTK